MYRENRPSIWHLTRISKRIHTKCIKIFLSGTQKEVDVVSPLLGDWSVSESVISVSAASLAISPLHFTFQLIRFIFLVWEENIFTGSHDCGTGYSSIKKKNNKKQNQKNNSLSGSNLGSYALGHDTLPAMLGSHFQGMFFSYDEKFLCLRFQVQIAIDRIKLKFVMPNIIWDVLKMFLTLHRSNDPAHLPFVSDMHVTRVYYTVSLCKRQPGFRQKHLLNFKQ